MTMENTDGGLHPAVDGQSLNEDEDEDVGGRKSSFGVIAVDIFSVYLINRSSSSVSFSSLSFRETMALSLPSATFLRALPALIKTSAHCLK